MLTLKRASEIYNIVAPEMKIMLGLQRWTVRAKFVEGEHNKNSAQCDANHSYKVADITFWLDDGLDEETFVDTIRHEMLHIYHSGFSFMYQTVFDDMGLSHDQKTQLSNLYLLAAEDLNHNLEYLLNCCLTDYGYQFDAKKLLKRKKVSRGKTKGKKDGAKKERTSQEAS